MKKLLLTLIIIFTSFGLTNANYKLENGSQDFVKKYKINTQNLDKEITRKEFIETLYKWYPDYKKDRGVLVDITNYTKLDINLTYPQIITSH